MALVTTGITIAFATSAFSCQILKVGLDGKERKAIPSSHMGTFAYETFIPGKLVDPGMMDLEIIYDPDAEPPIGAVAEVITITFPKKAAGSASGHIKSCSGFITAVSEEGPLEDKLTAKIKVKFSGSFTETMEV